MVMTPLSVWKAGVVFDPSMQVVCACDPHELEGARRTLRSRLDAAGVHPVVAREMMLAFAEITIPRTDSPPEAKITADLAVGQDELTLRVQLSASLVADQRQSGEQDLMLHLLADSVNRLTGPDGSCSITVSKRRVGR